MLLCCLKVARRLFDEPRMKDGGDDIWLYGSDESLELHVGGPRRGTWYDHKADGGGDTLDTCCCATSECDTVAERPGPDPVRLRDQLTEQRGGYCPLGRVTRRVARAARLRRRRMVVRRLHYRKFTRRWPPGSLWRSLQASRWLGARGRSTHPRCGLRASPGRAGRGSSVGVAVKASATASMRCSRRRLCSTTTGTSFAVALAGIGNRPAGPDLKPESCSDFPLRTVEGNKTNLLCSWRDVERRGDVPQIRTPQVARLQRSRQLDSQGPIWQDPLDAGEYLCVEFLPLASERRAQFRPLRSARNRFSAPALRAAAASGLRGARRRTRTPRRSSSSSRSAKVRGVFSIGRISAIGSPRRVTVTGVPECTRRSTSEKRALASYVEKEAFIALL